MHAFQCRLAFAVCALAAVPAARGTVFINEVDYDQPVGVDTAEFIELAGTAGTNLSGWAITLLNGTVTPLTPASYQSFALPNFTFADETGTGWGFCVLGRPTVPNSDYDLGADSFVQNGPNDGIQLFNVSTLVQCLSYEGSIAGETHAIPTTLADDDASVGTSLYMTGTGAGPDDFTWAFGGNTPGGLNPGQMLVPEPAGLVAIAGAAVVLRRRRR